MNIHNVFPVQFFEFENLDLIEPSKELLKTEKNSISQNYIGMLQTQSSTLCKHDRWKFLTSWIEVCLGEIKTKQVYELDGSFNITQMWGNISQPQSGGRHSIHRHPNSFFSGIFYLTEGSPTVFSDPVYARSLSSLDIPTLNNFDSISINPKPGSMIIFPSYVQHYTQPHFGDDFRITMSWNCMPNGFLYADSKEGFSLTIDHKED